jgi:hypothetical protein
VLTVTSLLGCACSSLAPPAEQPASTAAATAAGPMIVIIFFIDWVLNLLVLLVFVVVPLQMT